MTARKLIEFGDYRIVRVHRGFTALEVRDGSDWLGVARWVTPLRHHRVAKRYSNVTRDGNTITVIDVDWFDELLNALGDAMMREKKRGRGKRRKGAK